MSDIMEFASREEFRKWLYEPCLTSAGVWLLFGKAGGPKTIKAGEAQKNGQWYAPKPAAITEEEIARLSALLRGYEPA